MTIAEDIYDCLARDDIPRAISVLADGMRGHKTGKLGMTNTTVLISTGKQLGRAMVGDENSMATLMKLWRSGGRDARILVIGAMEVMSRKHPSEVLEFLMDVLGDVQDWEICDQMALRVSVNLLLGGEIDLNGIMNEWLHSRNKWTRRMAIATIPPYIRARPSHSKRCLDFLNDAMHESDRDVRKAVAWALREISKKNPWDVAAFLKTWAIEGDTNTRWIIRNGMKKLPEDMRREIMELMEG